jgi:hypothetical protein
MELFVFITNSPVYLSTESHDSPSQFNTSWCIQYSVTPYISNDLSIYPSLWWSFLMLMFMLMFMYMFMQHLMNLSIINMNIMIMNIMNMNINININIYINMSTPIVKL